MSDDDDDKVTDQAYKPPNSPEQSSGESLCTNMSVEDNEPGASGDGEHDESLCKI